MLTNLAGYDTGQISGFLEMPDFLDKFADPMGPNGERKFSNWKSGLIVALVCFSFAYSR
jgi:SP family sugar:H+ symporter-like MFS transporter